jgi:hypothetical protein
VGLDGVKKEGSPVVRGVRISGQLGLAGK